MNPDGGDRAREELLRAVLEAAPDPVFIKTKDHRYILANAAFLTTCGLTEAEGKRDDELFPPDFVAIVRQNDDQILQEGKVVQAEERLQMQGEWCTFSVTKFPLYDKDGKVVAMGGLALNITQRRAVEEANAELRLAHARAEAASEAKSRLLSTVSHELRTPLSGMIGLSELLKETVQGARERELLDHIQHSGRHLLAIINDLLDLSRAEAGKLTVEARPLAPRPMLAAICETLARAAGERRLTLRQDADPAVPEWVVGDVGRLRQVLFNLVGNAIKFSHDGEVVVRLHLAAGEPGCAPAAPPRLAFAVVDHGIGIREADVEQIFLPFEQTRDGQRACRGGTGLGLPICRTLVERMGGNLQVASVFGHGSQFFFDLEMPACAAPPRARQAPAAGRQGDDDVPLAGRVLVVDDCTTTRMVSCALLSRLGLVHDVAEDGAAALRLAAANRFDVVLMDVHLPDMDGPAVTRQLLAGRPPAGGRAAVIALSANAAAEERRACQQAGMVGYLVKPISLEELAAALRPFSRPASMDAASPPP